MGYVTINTDVDVYLDDFDDEDILSEAYGRLSEFMQLGKIRARDQVWLDKFSRLLNGIPEGEYNPSAAYYVKSMEELKQMKGYTFGDE